MQLLYLFLASEDGSNCQYEIIFDEAFTGGHTWRCGANKGYCLAASSFVNISYGRRLEANKKGEKLPLPGNWLPQGTAYPVDQVNRGNSPRANNRTNQKLKRSPKQNRSSKKPEKQSPDKVEVRILKRPSDKSMYMLCENYLFHIKHSLADKISVTNNLNHHENTVTSTVAMATSNQESSISKRALLC